MTSFSNSASQRILGLCRELDSNASIAGVLRDDDGHTIVRVRPGSESNDAGSLVGALRRRWPLARASTVESALDGSVQAQSVVPTIDEEHGRARSAVAASRWARATAAVAVLMIVAGLALLAREALLAVR